MKLQRGLNLFEALENICGFIALESDMDEIVSAVEKDNLPMWNECEQEQVSKRFSSAEKMAEWLHNNYEEIALNNGWKTQEDCQVPFLDLPKENKQTMIELCERLLNSG